MKNKTIHVTEHVEKIIALAAERHGTSAKKIMDMLVHEGAEKIEEGDDGLFERMLLKQLEIKQEQLEANMRAARKKISALNSKMQDDDLY